MSGKTLCAIAACLVIGCAASDAQTNSNVPVVYGFLNEKDLSLTFGPNQKAGQNVHEFLTKQSAYISGSNVTHVVIEFLPFSRSVYCQRPFDLRLVEAKLDVFINWMADGKIQFPPERRQQIPLEQIEGTLSLLCQEIGIPKPTILRGMGWKDSKTHNQVPVDTARKLADPQH